MTRDPAATFSGHTADIPADADGQVLWRAVARVYRRALRDCPQLPDPKRHAVAVGTVMALRPELGWEDAQAIATAVISGLSARYPAWFWETGPEAMRGAPEGFNRDD